MTDQSLVATLVDLSGRMTDAAHLMHQEAARWDAAGLDEASRMYRHANELRGAARIARGWARELKVPTAAGDTATGADTQPAN